MGVGVLVIAAFVVLAFAMWFIGERLEMGGQGCAAGLLLLVVVVIILAVAPKKSSRHTNSDEIKGHDETIVQRAFLMIAMVLGVLGSLLGLIVHHVQQPKYSRPLSMRQDILRQR
ncbi:hypothetical protein KFL_000580060 [Klebsormidium nitens]|uniref:Uncharacterized protein n=1 Tax=Klebsormidium nitens TaxID=105231 RepID=A0A1Y1HS21_KLENI|nr:hypothetical protein KFL_000580060 [Klebsormidium nitens]|eukprot:GAQ80612.1 hypothetical protein KFL_000580060 [Klebsormidium nitens]